MASKVSCFSASSGRSGGSSAGTASTRQSSGKASSTSAAPLPRRRSTLLVRDLGWVAGLELEVLPQHGDEREQRHVLAQRRAAPFEEAHRLVVDQQPLLELVDQARLAAACVADHRHDLGEVSAEPAIAGFELRQLLAAADQRREAALGGDRHRARLVARRRPPRRPAPARLALHRQRRRPRAGERSRAPGAPSASLIRMVPGRASDSRREARLVVSPIAV